MTVGATRAEAEGDVDAEFEASMRALAERLAARVRVARFVGTDGQLVCPGCGRGVPLLPVVGDRPRCPLCRPVVH